MRKYVCMYASMVYVCMHVCMYVCMYVCVYGKMRWIKSELIKKINKENQQS